MSSSFSPGGARSLLDDEKTCRKIALNYHKNREQDHTRRIDETAAEFRYDDWRNCWWSPAEYSLLHGTPLWEQASESQRVLLNQLYWVAYFSQVVSAEIATILLNQTSAAGLATIEDFRMVCDMLDLESSQERSHIAAFRRIGEAVEADLFGERLFTTPLRSMFTDTMLFDSNNAIQRFWRNLQLRAYTMLSAGNAFIACQYFTVRGLRTLNGRMIQKGLARPALLPGAVRESLPVPTRISFDHFMDESFHFNSSRILSHDVLRSLPQPTRFERWVANEAVRGCQRDHFHFSVTIRGIFWYEPALFPAIYRLLRSEIFRMDDDEARRMLWLCFGEESEGLHQSAALHREAIEKYRDYVEGLSWMDRGNRAMSRMSRNSLDLTLSTNRRELRAFGARDR